MRPSLGGGGGQGGLNLPLPVPFNPGSRPVFFGSRPFAFFRLRNIAQCCVIFPFFSRFSPPWESPFPPPLLPPPVHLPPPFLPVSRPPVPPLSRTWQSFFRPLHLMPKESRGFGHTLSLRQRSSQILLIHRKGDREQITPYRERC